MELIILISGMLSILTGILLWVRPASLIRTGEYLNKEVESNAYIVKNKNIFGSSLLVLGSVMVYFLIWG